MLQTSADAKLLLDILGGYMYFRYLIGGLQIISHILQGKMQFKVKD